ncbi:diacylglycerol/lipid kinase family protein [Tissierellaceae bacterium HCP3S3_D8]
MKKVKMVINPSSGRQTVESRIDYLCKLLLDDGYILGKYFTEKKDDAMIETMKTCEEDWDIIVVSGGDGTVNEVAKGIAQSKNKVPVAILSSGTVNDFANYMNIPTRISDFYNMIKREHVIDIDLGKIGDNYFVNVAAGGLLTTVGYQVQPEAKAILGRLAYYFEGVKELVIQGLDPINISFESEEYTSQDEILLFLISNSSSIGGFKKLAPDADVLDGLLDVLIIKESDVAELANIFFNVLTGEHINHPNVVYFKTRDITISTNRNVPIDIDGEYGGKLPANFQVVPKGMKLLI